MSSISAADNSIMNSSSITRSVSISSMSSSLDTSGIDVEETDIMDFLVADVKVLSDSLGRLTKLIEAPNGNDDNESDQALCVQVHDSLKDVSKSLKDLLDRYNFLRCSEVLSPASNVIHSIKDLKFDDLNRREQDESYERAVASLQKLQVAVANRVADYLTWEMSRYESSSLHQKLSQSSEELSGRLMSQSVLSSQKSHPPLTGSNRQPRAPIQRRHSTYQTKVNADVISSDQLDTVMAENDSGVEMAFTRCKAWSKYCKELLNFVQRRIHLEAEHAKALQKLADGTRIALQDEVYQPLHSIYTDSFQIETEFFESCTDAMKSLYEFKFIRPLELRKQEHDRKRKDLKATWDRHVKLVQDAVYELKKAQSGYTQRDSAYRKAMETYVKAQQQQQQGNDPAHNKLQKKFRLEEEAYLKRENASKEVDSLKKRLNVRRTDLEKIKLRTLKELRELIYQCDQTTKACTVAYFQSMSGLWATIPLQYQQLSERARDTVPGNEYMQFVKNLNEGTVPGQRRRSRLSKAVSDEDLTTSSVLPRMTRRGSWAMTPEPSLRLMPEPPASSSNGYRDPDAADDGLSVHSSYSDLHFRNGHASGSQAELGRHASGSDSGISDAAQTHKLQKIRGFARCAYCSQFTVFQTQQCQECGMQWHKNCARLTTVACGPAAKRMSQTDPRKMRIFGCPIEKHLQETGRTIPLVVDTCVQELDKRGCRVKGLYRVCGVKSRIEKICEEFERDRVDLTQENPTNIASVVKLYLRQLPESLLTNTLYDSFLKIAKDYPQTRLEAGRSEKDKLIAQFKSAVGSLPTANYNTLKFLVLHLKRMTWFESENHMNATNMGIVFGPSLIWRDESLSSLIEAPQQTRLVELLIRYAYLQGHIENKDRQVEQVATDFTRTVRALSNEGAARPAAARVVQSAYSVPSATDIFDVDQKEERLSFYERQSAPADGSSLSAPTHLRRPASMTDAGRYSEDDVIDSAIATPDMTRNVDAKHARSTTRRSLTCGNRNSESNLFSQRKAHPQHSGHIDRRSSGMNFGLGQSSPTNSEGSNDSVEFQRFRNSATPDLLKTRPKPDRPPSSPTSSAENASTASFSSHQQHQVVFDNSTSDEDLTSAVARELRQLEMQSEVSRKTSTPLQSEGVEALSPNLRLHSSTTDGIRTVQADTDDGRDMARFMSGESGQQRQSSREHDSRRHGRFLRGRPIRRNSKPRSFTTSILVNSSGDDLRGGSSSLGHASSDDSGVQSARGERDYYDGDSQSSSAEPDHAPRSHAPGHSAKPAESTAGGTLHILLDNFNTAVPKLALRRADNLPSSRGNEGPDGKKSDATVGTETVRLLLSGDPKDLSYV